MCHRVREVVVTALNAGRALGSNVGSQLKSSLSGMPVPGDPGFPGQGRLRMCSVMSNELVGPSITGGSLSG